MFFPTNLAILQLSPICRWNTYGSSLLSRRDCPTQQRLASIFAYYGLWSPSGGRYGTHCKRFEAVSQSMRAACMPLWRSCWRLRSSESTVWFCKYAAGRITRHQAINDVIARAFVTVDIPVTREPTGLSINVNKRPDGFTVLLWREGKPLAWEWQLVICSLAQSYVIKYSTPGAAAELTATRKSDK